MKVLNFGSLNIDYVYSVEHFVKKGETLASDSLRVYGGGKGLNQSIALARAGLFVSHAGAVGEDGRFLLEILEHAGVDIGCICVQNEIRTGSAVIQNDRDGDNCIILYGGANQSISRDYVDKTLSDFGPGDYIILQNEISQMDYIMEKAHSRGMVIALNPSPMNSRILKLPLEYADFFLVNKGEAEELSGLCSEKEEEVLLSLIKKFPKAKIVLTRGEKGSIYWDGKKVHVQEAISVTAVDTTAAGDTYTGYFMAGIIQGKTIEDTLLYGAAASALAVTRHGAAPSIPDKKEVEAMIKKIAEKERKPG